MPDALSSAPLWMSVERNASEPERHAPAAEVVVVAAHDDRLVGQRPDPFEHADHVPGRDRLALDLDPGAQRPAGQLGRAGLEVGVDLLLQGLERRLAGRGQQLVAEGAGDHQERERRVQLGPGVGELEQLVLRLVALEP